MLKKFWTWVFKVTGLESIVIDLIDNKQKSHYVEAKQFVMDGLMSEDSKVGYYPARRYFDDAIVRAASGIISKSVRDETSEIARNYVTGEAFLDRIVERLRKKQLSQ